VIPSYVGVAPSWNPSCHGSGASHCRGLNIKANSVNIIKNIKSYPVVSIYINTYLFVSIKNKNKNNNTISIRKEQKTGANKKVEICFVSAFYIFDKNCKR
jgi:hypothetical protein